MRLSAPFLICSLFLVIAEVAGAQEAPTPPPAATTAAPADPPIVVTAKPLMEGYTDIKCIVSGEGRLTDCVVTNESPQGRGIGDAALRLATLFKLKPATANGLPVNGAVYKTRIRFKVGKD